MIQNSTKHAITTASELVLKAANIDLVPFTLDDVDDVYQSWLNDDKVVEFLDVSTADRSMSALRSYIQATIDNPNRYFYLIIVRDENRRIGTASFEIDQNHKVATWGYLIGDLDYWGTGASLEAQVAIFDFAFDRLGARRFWGGAHKDNIASRFNLKRLGFTSEGVLRHHVLRDGVPVDVSCYGLMAEEWQDICGKYDQFRFSN